MLPLYDHLVKEENAKPQKSKLGVKPYSMPQGAVMDIKFDELVSLVFRDVGSVLLEIYKVYFMHEVKGFKGGMPEDIMWKHNERQAFEFMRDFDVYPSLLNKTVSYKIYSHTKE